MTRPRILGVLTVTIGLVVALAVYRFGPWTGNETLDGVRFFVRLAVIIGAVISWSSLTERSRAERLARALALIRESAGRHSR